MGSRPLRMKVRWGCPPRVLSSPPHRTQSWRPCLPGQPWASGFFPEVHEELTKSWIAPFTARSRSSASSILTTLDGGVARGYAGAFPRWRERSRCTCAHETPPLGGTVCVSRPRPVSWQPLSRPKLIALRARQPPPCTPWLSCRFTKPRRSNRCTRVVPTRGWCRSCARRLTSLYALPREGDVHHGGPGAPSLAQPGRDEGRRQGTLSRGPHLPGRAVRRHRRGLCQAVLGGTAADRGDPAHRRDAPSTAAPGARPQSARRRGCPPASSRAAPPQAESIPRPAHRASRRRAAPPQPPTRRCWNWLFLRRRQEQRRSFPRWRAGRRIFHFCSAACPRASGTHLLKKEQFPFPLGSQVHGTTVCDALLPHSRPRPILPVAKRVRFGDDIPPHAPLASPVWDPGSSVRMP